MKNNYSSLIVIAEAGHIASALRAKSIFLSIKVPVEFDLLSVPPTTRDLFKKRDFASLA